jgi:hypothetical protein
MAEHLMDHLISMVRAAAVVEYSLVQAVLVAIPVHT